MHCRYCGDSGHNRTTCSLRKAGVRPKLPTQRNPVQEIAPETATDQVPMDGNQESAPLVSQLNTTMLSHMQEESSHNREHEHQPLPDSTFITNNRPCRRPMAPTTLTTTRKRKNAPATSKKNAPAAPKKKKA